MQITIDFTYPIQDSVSVGDTAYYVYTNESGGFDINSANVVEIGEILSINRTGVNGGSILCDTELYGNELALGCGGVGTSIDCVDGDGATAVQDTPSGPAHPECGDPFVLFSKNNCQNLKSLLGYYSLFRFVNNSKDKAELFNITVDAYESSK